jgi:hypothetical protein
MPEIVKCEAHENAGSCNFWHQTPMRNRIKPVQPSFGHPLSDTFRPDSALLFLSNPMISGGGLYLFPLCSI